MGNENSKTDPKKLLAFQSFLTDYTDSKKIYHNFFGDVKIATHKINSEETAIIKELWFNSPKEAEKFQNLLKKRQISHNFLSKPAVSCTIVKENMCSTLVRFKFACKSTILTMAELIHQKLASTPQHQDLNVSQGLNNSPMNSGEEFFSEPEIWYILDGLVHMAKQFKSVGCAHGFIQPEVLYIDQDGHLAIPDVLLFLTPNEDYEEESGIVNIYEYEKIKAAVSPEIMNSLRKNEVAKYDPFPAEIWSICLTVLCISANCELTYFYDWFRKKIHFDLIKEKLNYMAEIGYSDYLIQLLCGGLERKISQRTTIEDLYKYLTDLESKIQDHDQHIPNHLEGQVLGDHSLRNSMTNFHASGGISNVANLKNIQEKSSTNLFVNQNLDKSIDLKSPGIRNDNKAHSQVINPIKYDFLKATQHPHEQKILNPSDSFSQKNEINNQYYFDPNHGFSNNYSFGIPSQQSQPLNQYNEFHYNPDHAKKAVEYRDKNYRFEFENRQFHDSKNMFQLSYKNNFMISIPL